MKTTVLTQLKKIVWILLFSAGMAQAQTGTSSPSADTCKTDLKVAELSMQRGKTLQTAKQWEAADKAYSKAENYYLDIADRCGKASEHRAITGAELAKSNLLELKTIRHRESCLPAVNLALGKDLKSAQALAEKMPWPDVEKLFTQAEQRWEEAVAVCQGPMLDQALENQSDAKRGREHAAAPVQHVLS